MWARLLNAALGIWLMAAPAVFGYADWPAATNDRIVGPLVVTMAISAIWGVTRPLRRVNLAFGTWLLAAPWLLQYPQTAAIVNDSAVGVLLALFSLVAGPPPPPMDGGWRMLFASSRKSSDR